MKRSGFTLVELLVAVSIIAMLVAMLIPSLGRAKDLSRATVCKSNLHTLHGAFTAAAQAGAAQKAPYPTKVRWPMDTYDAVPEQRVFRCPEDTEGGKPANSIPGLMYVLSASGYGDVRVPFEDCLSCATRTGSDNDGPYVDYVFEESPGVQVQWCPNGRREYPNCNHHDDKDGVFRFRTLSDGRVTMTLLNFHDNTATVITLYGQRLWPENPSESLHNYVGKTTTLMFAMSSYGINSAVGGLHSVKSNTVVLVDYDEQAVDMEFPDLVARHLALPKVARHLGRVNTLFADGSVVSLGPTQLNPRIHPDLWSPEAP